LNPQIIDNRSSKHDKLIRNIQANLKIEHHQTISLEIVSVFCHDSLVLQWHEFDPRDIVVDMDLLESITIAFHRLNFLILLDHDPMSLDAEEFVEVVMV
jgi:hypothetical protein